MNTHIKLEIRAPIEPLNRQGLRKRASQLKSARAANEMLASRFSRQDSLVCRVAQEVRAIRYALRIQKPRMARLTYNRRGIEASVSCTEEEWKSNRKYTLDLLRSRIRAKRADRRALRDGRGYLGGPAGSFANGVHLKPGTFLMLYKSKKAKAVYNDKRPSNADKHVGIELEFGAPIDKTELGSLLLDAGLEQYVTLKQDGSLRADSRGEYLHELCILVPEYDLAQVVGRVCAVLLGAKCYVNTSCGMHVHLDMRERDQVKSFHNLLMIQKMLYKMVPKSRQENTYCKPVRTTKLDVLKRSRNRYRGINVLSLRKHQTLEIRLHSGTLDRVKIVNWVHILLKAVNAETIKKAPVTVTGLKRAIGLNASLSDYVDARIKRFAISETVEAEASVGLVEASAPASFLSASA